MPTTWSYDGVTTLSVTTTLDDTDDTGTITLFVDDDNGSGDAHSGGSIGDTVTLTATSIGGGTIAAGDTLVANLVHNVDFFDTDFGAYRSRATKDARIFVYGTASSGVAYAPTWSFSGTTFAFSTKLDWEAAVDGDGNGFLEVAGSDCNSSAILDFAPGAQGSIYSRSITNVGHCDTSPFAAGESFEVQFITQNGVLYYLRVLVTAGLVADFSGTPTAGPAPLTVSFTDLSFGGTPTSWSWDFGDGGTSTAQNPTHTYLAPGVYTVSLTVSDGATTDTVTKTGYIVVGDFTIVFLSTKSGFRAEP